MHGDSLPPHRNKKAYLNSLEDESTSLSEAYEKVSADQPTYTRWPAGLPQELNSYLTSTDNPLDVYSTLRDSRDRQLRLVLRRFTNQIQYGCRNPYCTVTTCLSYRKRHAITPVRPYTDVAARALAWHYVEQYAGHYKEQNPREVLQTKRKGKSKPITHDDNPNLCWNEPVVPWYEDPAGIDRRKDTVNIRRPQRSPAHNERPVEVRLDSGVANGHYRRSSQNQATAHGERPLTLQDAQITHVAGSAPSPDSTSARQFDVSSRDRNMQIPSETPTKPPRHVAFADPIPSATKESEQQPKDTASFTQMLYDTSSLKTFDHVRLVDDKFIDRSNIQVEQISTGENELFDTDAHRGKNPWKISGINTFRILPLSALLWLRFTLPIDTQRSVQRDFYTTVDYGEYSAFARQSLYFCLSHPLRLLESASTWRFVHSQPHRLDEAMRTKIIRTMASAEQSGQHASGSLPQPGGIMVAFGMVVAITSIPELLSHLIGALQHAYTLPSWMNSTRTKLSGSKDQTCLSALHQPDTVPLAPSQSSPSIVSSNNDDTKFLDDEQIARLCFLSILALQLVLALKPQSHMNVTPSRDFGEQYSLGRKAGMVFPQANLHKAWSKEPDARPRYQAYAVRLDIMDDWNFQRLSDNLTDIISHRLAISEMEKSNLNISVPSEDNRNVVECLMDEITLALSKPDTVNRKQALQFHLIDLLRSVVSRRWDRNAIVMKCGPVHGALELLAAMYRRNGGLGIAAVEFQWPFMASSFDEIEMPTKWLEFRENSTRTHILSYSFLFEPATLVTYFRAINSFIMRKSHEYATFITGYAKDYLHDNCLTIYGSKEVLSEIRPNMAKFLVLTIRRDNMLQDAINQIWRRQRQELMRPLKVRLGKDEGEDGLDHGGVQAEFFRMIFAEALSPDYGMFTIDERTRMIWFQPASLEPLYKFEALGILMSLAVYNGVTLPVTFPLAFYRKLLGFKVKTTVHIKDGWPDLASGLQQLLDWKDGDVGDVIARTYDFNYEAFGASYTIDMTKMSSGEMWLPAECRKAMTKRKQTSFYAADASERPSSSVKGKGSTLEASASGSYQSASNYQSPETNSGPTFSDTFSQELTPATQETESPLVTNANRNQYVKDYIYWLTDKSISPQFSSFASGFYTCLNRTALSIFTPEHLKTVIEGHQTIDIEGLKATTTYDEYKPTDDIIQWFWQVVYEMSPEQHKKLLEFVTASDRVPVNGIDTVVFIVQHNGNGDERLPSSSTCYGRLLLPKYSSKEVLKEKLEKAIENSVGFGSL